MPIFLDDQMTDLQAHDVAGALEAARQRLTAQGRVVVEVRLDGQTLSGSDLDSRQNEPVAATELRLYSADPGELAISTLHQVDDRLEEARELQDQAAQRLQEDRAGEAMEQVGKAVSIWLQVQQAVLNSAVLLNIDLDSIEVEGEPLSSFTDELLEQLKAARDALTSQDTVGLADVLAYEWPALVDRWHSLIARLIEIIDKQ